MTVTICGEDETERGRKRDEGVKGKVHLSTCIPAERSGNLFGCASLLLCVCATMFWSLGLCSAIDATALEEEEENRQCMKMTAGGKTEAHLFQAFDACVAFCMPVSTKHKGSQ